jgi:hypothetical protein
MKKIRGNKPIRVIIHMHMEISQDICVATFISDKQKYHVFLCIIALFSSKKSENRKAEQVLTRAGNGHQWEGQREGKGSRRGNMLQKMCTHAFK